MPYYRILATVVCAAGMLAVSTLQAEEARKPPQMMFDACQNKAEQEACEIKTPRGHTLSGKCRKGPRTQGQLLCMPKPPKRAVEACEGKAAQDDCSVTTRNGRTIEGKCRKGLDDPNQHVCVPKRHPGRAQGQAE